MRRLALLFMFPTLAHAGDFVTNHSATLPAAKTDARPLPSGADMTRYIMATDFNALRSAGLDLRDHSWATDVSLADIRAQMATLASGGGVTIGDTATVTAGGTTKTLSAWMTDGPLNPGGMSITASGSTTARTPAARHAQEFNVEDFGAVCNGSGNDGPAVNAAIAAMAARGGGLVRIPAKTCRSTDEIYMKDGVTVEGYGPASVLYIDAPAGGPVWDRTGVVWEGMYQDYPAKRPSADEHPDTIIAISSAARGATTVTASVVGAFAGVAPGDWVMIVEGSLPKWNSKIQHVRVSSKSGDVLTLARTLDFDFNGDSGGGIGVIRIDPVENAWLRNLTVRGGANVPWIFATGLAVGGGADGVVFDPTPTVGGQPFANDAHLFSVMNSTFKTGNFGGFNRSTYCRFAHNLLPNVGQSDGEYGEGASFNVVAYNVFAGGTGTNPVLGIGGGWHIDVSHNAFVNSSGNNPLKVTGGRYGRIAFNTFTNAAYGVSFGVDGGWATGQVVRDWEFIGNRVQMAASAGATDPAIIVHEYPNCENITITGNNLTHKIKVGDGTERADPRTFVIANNVGGPVGQPTQIPLGWGGAIGAVYYNTPTNAALQGRSFDKGDTYYSYDTTGNSPGFIVLAPGSPGTLNGGATTGSITAGTATLTVSSATGLKPGAYITIAGVSGAKRITAISGTTVTLATNADATVAGAAVAFAAPTFKAL